jgi:hypothetical protein
MKELSRILKEQGHAIGEDLIRKIVRSAGYRWRKARIVLTSTDKKFSEKLEHIRGVLSRLEEGDAFFSIDEYGPFAIKAQTGRSLVAPGEQRVVQQWQKSKGCIIITAAVELLTNQVTHFYSSNKNTTEMIHLAKLLIEQYRDRRKLYLSWDAASWHLSRSLIRFINNHNANSGELIPILEIAPLPAHSQFLNVIEAVFSGMSRAIIQNSDYKSIDEAKAAIDRYFAERNAYFKVRPKRAGRKIWGKEPLSMEFRESNNCKDPRYR